MIKFTDMQYTRPEISELEEQFHSCCVTLEKSNDLDEVLEAIRVINRLRSGFETMQAIASLRYYADLKNSFYEEERTYFDSHGPFFSKLVSTYYISLLKAPLRERLEQILGTQLFVIAESYKSTFSQDIVPYLTEENRLVTEYRKLLGTATTKFEDRTWKLNELIPLLNDKDRQTRIKGFTIKFKIFSELEEEIDDLFEKLVHVRTKISKKLGFENFIMLGYNRLKRSDYDQGLVSKFRDQVAESVVPFIKEIEDRKRSRLGLDSIKFYDEMIFFKEDPILLQKSLEDVLKAGTKLFTEMSEETKEFFTYMVDNELMDLVNRPNKVSGAFINFIRDYKAPFMFGSIHGTGSDLRTLLHEAGHGFQFYLCRDKPVPEYLAGTYEVTEIASMSMEILTEPWYHLFFTPEDSEKYKEKLILQHFQMAPYVCAVDEFQHVIYDQPELSKEERKQVWKDLEKKYLPNRDYDSNEYLLKGNFWQQQSHIFFSPFYYIDYALAHVCAMQFWKSYKNDPVKTWGDFVKLCKYGGTLSFLDLIEKTNLVSPFEKGCLPSIIMDVKNEIFNRLN
ncbi:M3 family oligoendopeptidase [Fictibacillus sp. BK138]|uniref:M3 family oligoendopeptidase n=1 Tax=Fictibacillus sp. BK138 TaxID=2512121 RepID=UPI00102A11F8|nr:M3 family oligoendopeptidase [Fictibacillus sp. BK138]RZT15512.1 M3 family oligoendopeptidase [Fictibacillus sp. BK138]